MEEEQSKYKSARVLKFYKNYSTKDRLTVLKVFVKILDDNKGGELSKPKRIIEEFYSYSEKTYDELYDAYYRKIENIKGNKVRGIDDPDLFELIREFVFRHAAEKVWKLSPLLDVQTLGDSIDYFIAEDRQSLICDTATKKHDPPDIKSSGRYKPYISLLTMNEKKSYMVEFSRHDGSDNDKIGIKENLKRAYPNKVALYLSLIPTPNPHRNMAFFFSSDSVIDFYYGVNSVRSNLIFLKSWQYNDPLTLQYKQSEWDREENDNNNFLLWSSKPLMASGVEELTDNTLVGEPDYMKDYWQYRTKLQLTNGREKVESLHISDMLFDQLIKNRIL